MTDYRVVSTSLSEGFIPEPREQSGAAGLTYLAFDAAQIAVRASSDLQDKAFLVPVVGFETFMAKAAGMPGFDEPNVVAQATRAAAAIIAFFEEFHTQVEIIDIELLAELVGSGDFSSASETPWFSQLKADARAVVLPSAMDRLLWMERRSDFGGEVARTFDSLQACTNALPSSNLEWSRSEQQGGSSGRRYILLRQIQGDLLRLEGLEQSGIELARLREETTRLEQRLEATEQLGNDLARLREENTGLQQSLDEATLSQEISDLMITQLQEELELTLQQNLPGGEDPRYAAAASTVEVGPAVTPSGPRSPQRPRYPIKRWALAMFMAPSTRAQIRLLKASELFDPDWYCATYTDVANCNMAPEHHFLKFGAKEYRDPSPKFSTQRYSWQHPEIDVGKVNPLVHFLQSGSA